MGNILQGMELQPNVVNGPPRAGEGAAFPIVGVGISSGGLVALQRLLSALPPDTGMGFVIVSHLSPEDSSGLAEILSRATMMPVIEVWDEPAVKPDRVYVIPPVRDIRAGCFCTARVIGAQRRAVGFR